MALALLSIIAAGGVGASTLELDLDGLRNARGVIRACVTQEKAKFPDCVADPNALRQTVAATAHRLIFTHVRPGNYAVTLFHDENANARLDTLFGIPREGFGFSRNPVVRFGAPRYDNTSIELAPGYTRLRIRLQYLL